MLRKTKFTMMAGVLGLSLMTVAGTAFAAATETCSVKVRYTSGKSLIAPLTVTVLNQDVAIPSQQIASEGAGVGQELTFQFQCPENTKVWVQLSGKGQSNRVQTFYSVKSQTLNIDGVAKTGYFLINATYYNSPALWTQTPPNVMLPIGG